MPMPEKYQLREVFSAEVIAKRVRELATEIDAAYARLGAEEILLVGILKGACVFYTDLLRALKTPALVDFMQVSSYVGQQSSGELTIHKDLVRDIAERHVLVVEDIVDTGLTLSLLLKNLQERQPASLKLCTALDKAAARRYPLEPDFVGFGAEERFWVGYGLDYNEYFRGLPYIGELILE